VAQSPWHPAYATLDKIEETTGAERLAGILKDNDESFC
jgi:hypothetical protein